MINILIVGHGFVGQAVDYGFSHPHVTKTIVDPKYGTNLDSTDVSLFDIAFVCVPTPMGNDGAVDSSIIDDVLNELVSSNITIVVKSTVTPDIATNWPINVVYNPEFLTEKSANSSLYPHLFMYWVGGAMQLSMLRKCMSSIVYVTHVLLSI